jgi:hypothetical protein
VLSSASASVAGSGALTTRLFRHSGVSQVGI